MSCRIRQSGRTSVVVLESEMLIQDAAGFYQTVLPLACFDGAIRIDANASKSIHTSIMQILYALSQAVPDFAVVDASAEFRAAEIRLGLSMKKNQSIPIADCPSARQ